MRSVSLALLLSCCMSAARPAPDPTISIDVRNALLPDVIALIAKDSGLNVVADASVHEQRVTLRISGLGAREVLELVASSQGLAVTERDGVAVVGAPSALNRELSGTAGLRVLRLSRAPASDVARSLQEALPQGTVIVADARTNSVFVSGDRASLTQASALTAALDAQPVHLSGGVDTQTQRLRFARAEDVAKDLKILLPSGTFVADDQQNAIVISGDPQAQRAADRAIADLDQPGPEVLFEVRVADVTPANDSADVGLEFGGLDLQGQPLTGATTYAFSGAAAAINVRLNALVTNGHAQILATPRLVTLNGQEADLLIGETYPVVYSTSVLGGSNVQFVDIGVKLRLTPTIGPDGSVTAELHPEYSELQGFTSSGYPIIANRKIDSTLRVETGDTIVLGGLLRDSSSTTIERVPWLSDIPILGKVFQDRQTAHERDEIVFLITPHIIDPSNPPTR